MSSTQSSPPSVDADGHYIQRTEQKKMGRRALIAGGGVVAAGLLVAEAPLAIKYGRHLFAVELANLEGIGLDAASAAADITSHAVELIVMPIADTLAYISGDTLGSLISAVSAMEGLAGTLGINPTALKALNNILTGWKANVALFPATVHSLNTVQRDAGKKYLASLKAKQKQEAANSF